MFFYELHEGDDEVYSDVLVVSESEWEPQEFFELVQRIRHEVQDHYEHDTLIEAIASVLERDYGFIFVSDDTARRRRQRVKQEADNFLAELEADDDDDDDDDDDETRTASLAATSTRSTPSSTRRRPPELSRRAAGRAAGSAAEQDLDHVAVADPVGLALRAQPAGLPRLGHRAQRSRSSYDTVSARMKPRARSVWMAPAASTARRAVGDRPGADLVGPGGQERDQPEQPVRQRDDPVQAGLGDARARP